MANAQNDIYVDDEDRKSFLNLLQNATERYHWYCHAYCLMSNHYHLLIETEQPTLSKGMKYINGVYTQQFNIQHKRVGHVFQGRFKGILVESEAYLLELARYIVLNPVRARMVRSAKDWPWSSYRATAGITDVHLCLVTDWVLSNFSKQKKRSQESYRQFVRDGKGQPSPWESLKNQIYLGSDEFVDEVQCKMRPEQSLKDIPKLLKQAPPKPLEHYELTIADRKLPWRLRI